MYHSFIISFIYECVFVVVVVVVCVCAGLAANIQKLAPVLLCCDRQTN